MRCLHPSRSSIPCRMGSVIHHLASDSEPAGELADQSSRKWTRQARRVPRYPATRCLGLRGFGGIQHQGTTCYAVKDASPDNRRGWFLSSLVRIQRSPAHQRAIRCRECDQPRRAAGQLFWTLSVCIKDMKQGTKLIMNACQRLIPGAA